MDDIFLLSTDIKVQSMGIGQVLNYSTGGSVNHTPYLQEYERKQSFPQYLLKNLMFDLQLDFLFQSYTRLYITAQNGLYQGSAAARQPPIQKLRNNWLNERTSILHVNSRNSSGSKMADARLPNPGLYFISLLTKNIFNVIR